MAQRVIVVGGGAAGLAAAVAAAWQGAHVTVIESEKTVGHTILATGNGRCNFTNSKIVPEGYNQPRFVTSALERYTSQKVIEFFEKLGLDAMVDEEGRVYPVTNMATSVLEVLLHECARFDVEFECKTRVVEIDSNASANLIVSTNKGMASTAEGVVVATGGDSPLLHLCGHKTKKSVPVLCSLKTRTDRIAGFDGIRMRCAATLLDSSTPVKTERGELLFRSYGVSGIMVFDLSRYASRGQKLSIDFFPDLSIEALTDKLEKRCEAFAWRRDDMFFDGLLPSVIGERIVQLASRQASSMAALLKDFRLEVQGMGDAKRAQVMRGGACVDEFNPQTLESLKMPMLYGTGEALDVDGRCGGFNLHWAWASGLIAGEEAARQRLALPVNENA